MPNIINMYIFPAPAADIEQRPGIRMSNPDFIKGYESGKRQALHGLNAGVPLTDTEIVDIIKNVFADLAASNEPESVKEETLLHSIGSLIGELTARW